MQVNAFVTKTFAAVGKCWSSTFIPMSVVSAQVQGNELSFGNPFN